MTSNPKNSETEKEMTEQDLKEFDEASNPPYECKCKLCLKWWELMGKER